MSDLAPIALSSDRVAELLATWLGGKAEGTRLAYAQGLRQWARFCGAETAAEGAAILATLTGPEADERIEAWKGAMMQAGLSPATIALRIAALASFAIRLRRSGVIAWRIEVERPKRALVRDVRGIPEDELRGGLVVASTRDRAVLALLGLLGLRRGEVAALRLDDVGPRGRTLLLLRKGQRERTWITLPWSVAALLRAWLTERGPDPGSLFGVSGSQISRITHRLLGCNPHALRHTCAGLAIDETRDLRATAALLGHGALTTTQVYLDALEDRALVAADAVARRILGSAGSESDPA